MDHVILEASLFLSNHVGGTPEKTTAAAPLFEYSRVKAVKTSDLKSLVTSVENAIVKFHNKYK